MKPRLVVGLCLLFGAVHAWAQNSNSVAVITQLELTDPTAKDLSAALKIQAVATRFTLDRPHQSYSCCVEFYQNGKLVWRDDPHGIQTAATPFQDGRLAIEILDTDFLRLGDSRPGHVRFVIQQQVAHGSAMHQFDVPKSSFDSSKGFSVGLFPKRSESSQTGTPVMFFGGNCRDHVWRSGSTSAEVVQKNPQCDIAIVYLRFE